MYTNVNGNICMIESYFMHGVDT